MEITHKIQCNCSEWNEEVGDYYDDDYYDWQALKDTVKKAEEQKEWD